MTAPLLPLVKCVLILDDDGGRVSTKYYDKDSFGTHSVQTDFEDKLWKKTKNINARSEADVVLLEDCVAVFRSGVDIHVYVVGSADENELILTLVLDALYDSLNALLRGQLDKRTLLDNLALVLLAVDELCDGGKILEVDPSAITNRVLMKGATGGPPPMTELTIQQAIATAKEEFIRRMGN
ncbi:coatomer protein complex, zeta sub-unit [Tribonema minus]|uniref:Coatomer subunit zeta n=1 Tax=Tribonema minus TaxID=303371 RepID=A0A836C7T9_9STRA|nr:coatomer protein complex, zeta sub-unit [Tribonema minus]|eukprot:TRINITY_DN1677_c0_g1_i2.p1 TRINITY_DN1677_c0_g1~~TRINITY_DN1677_c0_g1_i2.p1  ORF type:complete len:182 (-),score=79.82 TRINITY_DN1677_c0_g1_i2:179-724(-)